MSVAAILLAAGRGERLGSEVPKAFVELDGRPLLLYSLDVIRSTPAVAFVVVAAPAGWEGRASALAGQGALVVTGGDTRQRSVAAALEGLVDRPDLDVVVCHDVARPLASTGLFESVVKALSDADGAIPVVPVVDTLKRVEGGRVLDTVPRDRLVRVQTPQAFRGEALVRAHGGAASEDATDDAALLERIGLRVAAVHGEHGNIKITEPEDLQLASFLRSHRG